MLTFLAATFAISQTLDLDVKRQDRRGAVGGGGWVVEHFIPVRGDVQNSRISTVEHRYVVGALLLQIAYGIRYSNENIPRQKCDDVGGLLPVNQP